MNKNSTATEEELEQHVMVGEMVMSQDDVDSQTLSILVYLFPRMSLYLPLSVSEYDDKLDPQRDRCL
jgi:hypothetical protein